MREDAMEVDGNASSASLDESGVAVEWWTVYVCRALKSDPHLDAASPLDYPRAELLLPRRQALQASSKVLISERIV